MIEHKQLISLAEEYGTPLYVYDGDLILQRYKELYGFIKWPKLKIFYAMKANYNPSILRMLQESGAFVDAVSPAEVLMALKTGFPKERILYTANNMAEEEMHEVHGLGVLFNIGSLSRLEKYGAAFPNTEVCLRFNPDVVAGEFEFVQTGGDLTKFGILRQDVPKVKEIIARHNLTVVGLHEHTGSGIAETDKVYQSMQNLLEIATPEDFPDLRFIDFGGGFKVPYKPGEKRIDYASFGKRITEIFSGFCKSYGSELEMCFEPGKYIVAESGYLVVRVNTLKDNKGRLIAGTKSGFPQLIRPVFYGAYHSITNLSNPNGPVKKYDVAGNICATGDVFAVQRELPEIREGDFLDIENAGAYCYSMGGVYNLRPMPAEVFVFNGEAKLSRRRLSSEELIGQIMGESQ
ncbi:MAG: diaminopimelate decarboxylase [Candidatus Diapherotrites archaeon]|nr:diaminopimelate decarboxylase [Candidatus Diapherotrites archaeon]